MTEPHTLSQVDSPTENVAETISAASQDTAAMLRLREAIDDFQHDQEPPPTGPPPAVGNILDRFTLTRSLGTGSSCFVFQGWDQATNESVAVKIVNWANVHDRSAAMRQMRTEAAALARVKHANVLRFIDFGIDPRWPFIVTEFLDGAPVGSLLRDGGQLPLDWATYILSQVVDGLGAVWKAGLVHRDIKPDNILVGAHGITKLIDFGLAKQPILQAMAGQTGPELAGTASYLAPEQARDASIVDLRADVYSLGVTFYEMLTGRLPFEARNRMQMIFHHLNTPPVPPNVHNPAIPPLVADLCMWMLMKSPTERPQDYEELRQAFDAVTSAG